MLNFHKDFKLNGVSFATKDDLLTHTKNLECYHFLTQWFSNTSFVEVSTSGSTGKPKTIQLKKEFMINSAKGTGNFFSLPAKTTALLCLSVNYIAGKMMLVRALTLGWHLDIVAPTSKVKIKKKYDFSAMVPLQVRNSLAEIKKIKKLIVGGGIVASDLVELLKNVSTKVFATYGMTETITHIAVKKLNNFNDLKEDKSAGLNAVKKSDSYKALPNIKIAQDQRNCLIIDAPKVSLEKIVTNDVVHLISDKEFEWLGRFDNVINSGGVKLHPEEIEKKISHLIKQRFFVAGIKDVLLGEKLILIIEGKKVDVILGEAKNLTQYEIPKEIYFVEKFIETGTKKIQRKKTLEVLDL